MDEAKRDLVRNWFRKAAHDLAAARLLGRERPPLLDVAVYHCQQAAEKAIKGFLAYHGVRPEKTHDLRLLLERAMEIEPVLDWLQDAADRLTPFATAYRYPGLIDQPEPEEFAEAIEDSEDIFNQVLAYLPPELHPVLGRES